jgi:peptide/nickel transport system permease protein
VRVTGDPTVLLVEPGASRADIDALRHELGLDRSLVVQYWRFVSDVVRGDFGRSFYYRTPVLELYLSRLPNSLLLAAAAMAFSLLIGIPSGSWRRFASTAGGTAWARSSRCSACPCRPSGWACC